MKSQPRSGSRTSISTALFAAFWTFFSFTFMFQLNRDFHSTLSFSITCFIVGIFIGIFFSALLTRRQLNTLEKKGEIPITLKTIFITIGAVAIAVAAISEVTFSNLPNVVESALVYSIIGCCPASWLTRAFQMFYWEKQKRTRIFQDNYGLHVSTNVSINRIEEKSTSNQTFQVGDKRGLS